ncbi:MAG: low temperature requirement protein A, partial [Nocardioides sp.]|nr:low temperature requirement protein A [Nocardioides sp.]
MPAEEDEELRVSTLELFFDLVFVFVITRLATMVEHDLTWAGVGRAALVFVVLYWMYSAFVWLTNQLPPTSTAVRLFLVAGMAAFLVCAFATPRAFSGDGVYFGVGLMLVVLVHAGLFALAYGWGVLTWAPYNVLGAGLVIWAGTVDAWWRYVLWLLPLAIGVLPARTVMRARPDQVITLRPGHFVERHGLLIIVAFGESVVAVGAAAPSHALHLDTLGVALLGLALSAALWWVYFDGDDERGEEAMREADAVGRLRLAFSVYFGAFTAILLGIVLLAAGTVLAL